jgi:KipI family sensor histidine kinase inhibitor
VRIRPYGAGAVLVEPDDPALLLSLAELATGLDGVREVVPAARTVLVVAEPSTIARVTEAVRHLTPSAAATRTGDDLVLDVAYDGADLADVATEVGLDVDDVVRAHSAVEYVVAFCGFVPGFGYLTGLDQALHVPRLAQPRTRVPAGAVAIAGEYTGVYPRASPGGWRLLGHTAADLWDLTRAPPALLMPGTRVRFRPK